MAFADWPTSDGHNMLLYPWLQDLRHTDKFVEHGHRLAGVLIGLMSIALVIVSFRHEKRSDVRAFALSILAAVIGQGLLGGMRVRMDEQVLAMTHSITGGLFFTLCFVFAYFTRRTQDDDSRENSLGPTIVAAIALLPLTVLGQYFLGGMFRHLGRMLHEHVAGAILVTVWTLVVVFTLLRSNLGRIRVRGKWLAAALALQVSLGLGAWVTKLGVPSLGWVAVRNSLSQNVVCSLHTVGGMFLLACSAAAAFELILLFRSGQIASMNELGVTSATDMRQEGMA